MNWFRCFLMWRSRMITVKIFGIFINFDNTNLFLFSYFLFILWLFSLLSLNLFFFPFFHFIFFTFYSFSFSLFFSLFLSLFFPSFFIFIFLFVTHSDSWSDCNFFNAFAYYLHHSFLLKRKFDLGSYWYYPSSLWHL